MQEKQLKLRGDREKNIYKKLKTWDFVLTPAYDPALLQATEKGGSTSLECFCEDHSQLAASVPWRRPHSRRPCLH